MIRRKKLRNWSVEEIISLVVDDRPPRLVIVFKVNDYIFHVNNQITSFLCGLVFQIHKICAVWHYLALQVYDVGSLFEIH